MARDSARAISCKNQLKQIGTSVMFYSNDYDGALPFTWDGSRSDRPRNETWRWFLWEYESMDNNDYWKCPSDSHYYTWIRNASNPPIMLSSYGANGFIEYDTNSRAGNKNIRAVKIPTRTIYAFCGNQENADEFHNTVSDWAGSPFNTTEPFRVSYRHQRSANLQFLDGHVNSRTKKECMSSWNAKCEGFWKVDGRDIWD
jgi:prepilin-type processing-associated H-X9-DG protein